jgi:hypothetical protein
MILFSIVYGKKYIDFLIDRAIPSLMTPRNKLFLEKTDNILYIATISEDVPYIRKQLRSLDLEKVFGDRIRIHHIPYIASKNDHEEPQRQNKLSYALLMRAMRFCYEQNQPFFLIPPDTIFSEELLEICWDLHQVTGKIVAVFNGRVSPLPETTNVNNSILARPDGVKRYFLENMDTCWLEWSSSGPDHMAGESRGHQFIKGERSFHVFTSAPNPLMGRFHGEDLFFFAEQGVYGIWDHKWLERLREQQRLLIQTNLDLCMTIEPWPSEDAMKVVSDELLQKEKDREERRSHFLGELFEKPEGIEKRRWAKYATHENICCFSGRLI